MAQISKRTTRSRSSGNMHVVVIFLGLVGGLMVFLWIHVLPRDDQLSASSILAIDTKAKEKGKGGGGGGTTGNLACTTNCVIDMLSIASKTKPEAVAAQKKTFATHVSVRNFFVATEDDDDDPECGNHLTLEDALEISNFCRLERYFDPNTQSTMDKMQHYFAKPNFLKKKGAVAGKWLCAQRRPIFGLFKVLKSYQNQNQNQQNGGTSTLPDYLVLMDDDTYINMQLFPSFMTDSTPDVPRVTPGCVLPFKKAGLTIPYGGFSTIINKAALSYMMKPRQCPQDVDFCKLVEGNGAGERHLFQNGMSLVDLMHAYVSRHPFRGYKSWNSTDGYCMHSDWVIGYFVNFYQASRQAPGQDPLDRLEVWHGSYSSRGQGHGFCKQDADELCPPKSLVCHYITPNFMVELHDKVRLEHPERFK